MNIVDETKRTSTVSRRTTLGRRSSQVIVNKNGERVSNFSVRSSQGGRTNQGRLSQKGKARTIQGGGAVKMLGMQMLKNQASETVIRRRFDLCSEEFFIAVNKELEKINLFFSERISAATRSYLEING